MTSFLAESVGRVLLLHLTKGDDLLNGIRQGIKEAGIQSGMVVSGIGSLRRFHYHYIGSLADDPRDAFSVIEKPLELASLQGIILEGEPHLHAVVTEMGVNAHAGHVEAGCEVQYLAEVSIVEINDLPVGRRAAGQGTVTQFTWLNKE